MNEPVNALLAERLRGKHVLYIATKNADYIRIQQEIKLIRQYAGQVDVWVSEAKNYVKRVLSIYGKLLLRSCRQYDVVFVGFMAQMILPLWKWKFRRNEIFVDFFISIYDTLVDDRKKIRADSVAAKCLHRLDRGTLECADAIVSDTRAHGDYFSEEFRIERQRIHTLYLEADTSYYHPMELERPKEWQGKYLVLYFGSILPVQGVDVILQAIESLKERQNIHFIMIGPIPEQYQKPITNTVTYIDWLPQDRLAEYISYADLCLGGHFSGFVGKAKRTIPGKVYIYQAMDKPVVLGDSPANRELFREDERHLFVPLGESKTLADQIVRCADKYMAN